MSRARQLVDRRNFNSLLMDASAASTDVADNILLDGTDSSSTDAGFRVLTEDFGTHVPYDSLPDGNRQLTDDAIYFEVSGVPTGSVAISHNTTTIPNYNRIMKDHNGNANIAADLNKFTCTVAGLYYLEHTTYIYISAGDASILTYNYSGLNVNGAGVGQNYRTQGYSGGSGYQWHMDTGTNRFQCIVPLSVGDYVEPRYYIYKTSGTMNNYYQARGKYPIFRGYLIKRFPSASAPT